MLVLFAGRDCAACATLAAMLTASGQPWRLVDIDEKAGYLELIRVEMALGTEAAALPVLLLDGKLIAGKEFIAEAIARLRGPGESPREPTARDPGHGGGSDTSPAAGGDTASAESAVAKRFSSYGVYAIAAAGLLDGINPCAFATVVFLFGALMAGNHSRRRMLAVGSSFALGVFLTYLLVGLVGLGAFHALLALRGFAAFRAWFHGGTKVLLSVMAALFMVDGLVMAARGGQPFLRMPGGLRRQANATIARGLHTSKWLAGGFALGMAVSLLELACTGQMYLPTPLYMLDQQAVGQLPCTQNLAPISKIVKNGLCAGKPSRTDIEGLTIFAYLFISIAYSHHNTFYFIFGVVPTI